MADIYHYLVISSLIAFLLASLFFLFASEEQRYFVVSLLSPRYGHRRTLASKYGPVSPDGKQPAGSDPPHVDYKHAFPLSTRERLARVFAKNPETRSKAFRAGEIEPDKLLKNIIPFTADWRESGPSILTPTGISLDEIRSLGDFPDYAELSGVPSPEPYSNFVLKNAIHRPYRPFRWAYYQTMSLTKMESDWWLELEKTYVETVAQRQELFRKHGKMVLDYLPGSELAAKEVMEMALQFYCARYPQFFSLKYSAALGWVFRNGILGTTTAIKDHHPLHVLLDNVPEDFALMLRNPQDGYYYFRGGVICSSLGWNLESKLGMQLKEIHEPIPDYKEKMEFSMDRYFSKMPTHRPIQRGSWGMEVDQPLFMPPGDPHELHRLQQDPELAADRLHLRVDWQTLRRLPLSGAIVFNFKGVFTPVAEFRDEPFVPALVLKVLTEGKPSIMQYKNTWHTEHVLLPLLRRWAIEQVDTGLVPPDWQVATLEESPMYPGWEEKWHRQQGF